MGYWLVVIRQFNGHFRPAVKFCQYLINGNKRGHTYGLMSKCLENIHNHQ